MWIQGTDFDVFSAMPLSSSELAPRKRTATKTLVNATMDVFQKVHRGGFHLREVATAPLAQRRKMKRSSQDTFHSSSSSGSGSCCLSELSRGSVSPSPIKRGSRASPYALHSSGAGRIFFPQLDLSNSLQPSQQNAALSSCPTVDSGTCSEHSLGGYFSFRHSHIGDLLQPGTPHSADLFECNEVEDCVAELNISPSDDTNKRGIKRRLVLNSEEDITQQCCDDSDDDCFIVEPQLTVKRHRTSTIVID